MILSPFNHLLMSSATLREKSLDTDKTVGEVLSGHTFSYSGFRCQSRRYFFKSQMAGEVLKVDMTT